MTASIYTHLVLYFTIGILFDAIWPELIKASLNKLQSKKQVLAILGYNAA